MTSSYSDSKLLCALTFLVLSLYSCVTFPNFTNKSVLGANKLETAKIVGRTLVVDSVGEYRLDDADAEADMIVARFINAETIMVDCYNHKVVYIFDISNHEIRLKKRLTGVSMFTVDQELLFFYLTAKKDSVFVFDPTSGEAKEFQGNPVFMFQATGLRYLGGSSFLIQLGDGLAVFDVENNPNLRPVKGLRYGQIVHGSNPPGSVFVFSPDIFLTEFSSSSLAENPVESRHDYHLYNPNRELNYLPGGMIERVEYVGSGISLLYLFTGQRRFPVDYPIYSPYLLYNSEIYQLPGNMRQLIDQGEVFYVVPK
jgi:hypothetical protein